MSRPPDDVAGVALAALEKYLKVVCYLIAANYGYDFICALPPEIGNRVIEYILKKLGI